MRHRSIGYVMRSVVAFAVAALLLMTARPAAATLLFQETFNTDTASTATTLATYPAFSLAGGGAVTVSGGVVQMPADTAGSKDLTIPGFAGDLLIQLDRGNTPGAGSGFNGGIRFGNNRIVFHPGFAPTPGAFRVEGTPPNIANTSMGFVPATGVLHHMELAVNSATGATLAVVTDGSNPLNRFAIRYTNATAVGGNIGLTNSGVAGGQGSTYDNLRVSRIELPAGASFSETVWIPAVDALSPLHWYRMDDAGSGIALDYGSAQRHAVYRNGLSGGDVTGPAGGASTFDGVNDIIDIGLGNLAGDWSAMFLVNKQGVEDAAHFLEGTGVSLRLDQWMNTGQLGYTAYGVADYLFTGAPMAPVGEWTLVTFVASPGTGVDVYLNDTFVANNPNYVQLGRASIGTAAASLNAILDEAVIFDRALSGAEIAAASDAAFASLPEPATVTLSLLALAGLLGRRRFRGRAAA